MAAVLGYGAHLLWAEHSYRQRLHAVTAFPPVARPLEALPTPDNSALLTVLGFKTQEAAPRSQEPAVLRGTVVSSGKQSRALLTVGGSQRSYREGERLPSGSVVLRIDAGRVFLWRNGREEVLPLVVSAQPVLRTATAVTPVVHSHLRPNAAKLQD